MNIAPNDVRFTTAGLGVVLGGEAATINMLDDDGKITGTVLCRVAVTAAQLAFYPQRSSAQRKVLVMLGVSVSE